MKQTRWSTLETKAYQLIIIQLKEEETKTNTVQIRKHRFHIKVELSLVVTGC